MLIIKIYKKSENKKLRKQFLFYLARPEYLPSAVETNTISS